MPRWAAARLLTVADELSADDIAMLRAIAAAVMPQSLQANEVADGFARWIRNYRAGAEMNSGYGFTRLRVTPPSPAKDYPAQIRALNAGKPFASLDRNEQRRMIAGALDEAKVDEVPQRPNGKHVASDLMSYFYYGSEGHDFLYEAAIRVEDCRGLPSSPKRPAPLEES